MSTEMLTGVKGNIYNVSSIGKKIGQRERNTLFTFFLRFLYNQFCQKIILILLLYRKKLMESLILPSLYFPNIYTNTLLFVMSHGCFYYSIAKKSSVRYVSLAKYIIYSNIPLFDSHHWMPFTATACLNSQDFRFT